MCVRALVSHTRIVPPSRLAEAAVPVVLRDDPSSASPLSGKYFGIITAEETRCLTTRYSTVTAASPAAKAERVAANRLVENSHPDSARLFFVFACGLLIYITQRSSVPMLLFLSRYRYVAAILSRAVYLHETACYDGAAKSGFHRRFSRVTRPTTLAHLTNTPSDMRLVPHETVRRVTAEE